MILDADIDDLGVEGLRKLIASNDNDDLVSSSIWEGIINPVKREEIAKAIMLGELLHPDTPIRKGYKGDHIKRIAWFVVYGWDEPIEVDVGIPGMSLPSWPIYDGNHRLIAAIFRKDISIRGHFSGAVEYARNLGILMDK